MRRNCQRWLSMALGVGMIPLALSAALLGLGGCGRGADPGAAAGPAAPGEDPPAIAGRQAEEPAGPPVTDQECRAFAASVADALRAGDEAAFSALVDWDALLRTATDGIAVAESSRKGFIQG